MLSTVLREIPKADLLNTIGDHLDRIAKLYQVPGWDALNTIMLSEWIIETYQMDTLKTVIRCLTRQRSEEKVWRLTPDTIKEWMTNELEELAGAREAYIHNKGVEKFESEWTQERLDVLNNEIAKVEDRRVAPMTEEDIIREGQERPIRRAPILPMTDTDIENANLAQQYGVTVNEIKHVRFQWMRECFHHHTGDRLPNWVSFSEWLMM